MTEAVGGKIRSGRAVSAPGLANFAVTAAAALGAWCAFAAAPATTLTTVYVDPENASAGYNADAMLPTGVAEMGALADGRHPAVGWSWPELVGSGKSVRPC